MPFTFSCYNLFLREVSRKKFKKLAALAHHDPTPLTTAIKEGFFKNRKKEALKLLEEEKKKAKYTNTKESFQEIIDILKDNPESSEFN